MDATRRGVFPRDGVVSTAAGPGAHRAPAAGTPGAVGRRAASGGGRDLRSHVVPSGGCLVSVSVAVWAATLAGLVSILAVDLLVVARRPHEPTLRECVLWVTGY